MCRKRLYLLRFLRSQAYNFPEIASTPYICVSISYYEFKVFSKVHISETVNDRNLSFVLPALILLKSMCKNFQGRILILKWFFKHVKLTIFANSTILSITAAGKFQQTLHLHVSWQFSGYGGTFMIQESVNIFKSSMLTNLLSLGFAARLRRDNSAHTLALRASVCA